MSNDKNLRYWHDNQIRRYILQLIRIFSHFEVAQLSDNGVVYKRVPCRYANASRMVSQIMRGNSENILNSAPLMTLAISNVAVARDRTQDPFYEDRRQVAEREWNKENGVYTSDQGNLYTLERFMPVPYDLTIQVDIWTTNTDQKLQLWEQLAVLFNPSIQLQSNDNPLDWSNVFEVTLTDMNWSSRNIGTDEGLEVMTLTFSVPIWISPPAKVTRQKIIQRIVANIHALDLQDDLYNPAYYDYFSQFPDPEEVIVTPNNLRIDVSGSEIQLVNAAGEPQNWQDIIEMQGELGQYSRIELNLKDDIDDESLRVVGYVSKSNDDSILDFTIDSDTLPANTISDIDRIIDPAVYPPTTVDGTRYLITKPILSGSTTHSVWGVTANEGNIIEYDGDESEWFVSFSGDDSPEWVTNLTTDDQYRWTGSEWISSWQGRYNEGYWRLIL